MQACLHNNSEFCWATENWPFESLQHVRKKQNKQQKQIAFLTHTEFLGICQSQEKHTSTQLCY